MSSMKSIFLYNLLHSYYTFDFAGNQHTGNKKYMNSIISTQQNYSLSITELKLTFLE